MVVFISDLDKRESERLRERDSQREKERGTPWGREHEHRALSIKVALLSAMREGAPSTERFAMSDDDDDDEDEQATAMTSELRAT